MSTTIPDDRFGGGRVTKLPRSPRVRDRCVARLSLAQAIELPEAEAGESQRGGGGKQTKDQDAAWHALQSSAEQQ